VKTRREFLVALGAGLLTASSAASAQQQSAKVVRIGYLGAASASTWVGQVEALRGGLRDLGYVEGGNIVIEYRWAEGKYDRLPELAAELVRLKVDLIVTHGVPASRAAKQATTTLPIVIASTGDPVATGLVASEAQPGGNITGLSSFNPEINAKRLELLKQAMPRVSRVGVLMNPDNPGVLIDIKIMEAGARSMKVELQHFQARGPNEFESAFATMAKRRVEAVAIVEDGMMIANAGVAAGLATRYRIPSIGFIAVAEAGGLMAYGVNILEQNRRAAVFVDKILKGTRPGDIPIERATKFELVVNMKTAKALGLTMPQPFLMRADRVIE
jgi:putative ABC transport system substrate-binding protein